MLFKFFFMRWCFNGAVVGAEEVAVGVMRCVCEKTFYVLINAEDIEGNSLECKQMAHC